MSDASYVGELKAFLDEKVDVYNNPDFISLDPISIPHRYSRKEDIEVSGFIAATIAWGNRKSILKNAGRLMDEMGESPFDFIQSASKSQLTKLNFVHRTFNTEDLRYFLLSLRHLYTVHGGMQAIFEANADAESLQRAISRFKHVFFELPHSTRTRKHVSDPLTGSAAKRLNMMLRWFVRKDKRGVDFGIWNDKLKPAQLSIPLDIHSGTIARELGLLQRRQNDAKAVEELDRVLRGFDSDDPVKYDFALFGLGVNGEFENFMHQGRRVNPAR